VCRKQSVDAAEKRCFTERPGKHRRDSFDRIRDFQDCERIGGAVEDAHRWRALPQTKGQVWPGHSFGMHIGDEQIDGASTGFSQLDRLAGVCRRQDKEISFFQNLLHGLAKRFQVFDNENDRMNRGLRLHSAHPNLDYPEMTYG
jgi:hypothetical protein